MSYALEVFLTDQFATNATLIALLGKRADGGPAIYPYHHRDTANLNYPLVTIARFGSKSNGEKFSESPYANQMDAPRIAICAWSKNNVDEAVAVISVIRNLIRPPSFDIGNGAFWGFKLTERTYRDDLFDTNISAYHVHTEYDGWVQELYGNPQPVPA